MGTVNISSAWSKENRPRNGLVQIEDKLVDDDLLGAEYWGVVRVEPNFYKVDGEDGTRTPTVRIAHIEVVTADADIEAVRTLLQRRFKDRTGIDDQPPASLFDVLPGDGGEQDGEPEVPEADGAEILAERAERKAAEAEAERAGRAVPSPFSAGGDDAA